MLPDFRVHRAGVYRALGQILDRLQMRSAQIHFGIGHEFLLAVRGAEVVARTIVLGAVLGSGNRNAHAANRINRYASGRQRAAGRVAAGLVISHLQLRTNAL